MSELFKISELISKKVKGLAKGREILKKRAEDKANKGAEYDKELALMMIKLKNGEKIELDGQTIESPPATILEKIAKGVVWRAKLEAEKAEALYKAAVTNMNAINTEISALQTLLRYEEEISK
jgi:hypothetical protein